MPNHRPSFWDPHKDRHQKKSHGARDLKKECEVPCSNLLDLKRFLSIYSSLEKMNKEIDRKGGRLGEVLSLYHDEMDHINNQFFALKKETDDLIDLQIDLINQRIAHEEEMEDALEYMRFDEDEHADQGNLLSHTEINKLRKDYDAYTADHLRDKILLSRLLIQCYK